MKILVAIDGSPCSKAMLAEVGSRPWPTDSTIKVVTVDPPLEPSFLKTSPGVFDDLTRQQRDASNQLLDEAVALLRKGIQGPHIQSQLLAGWPKEAILDEAEHWGADLIVVGSHGYGTIRRFFLGSVSMTIAMNATCSVMIVRPTLKVAPAAS